MSSSNLPDNAGLSDIDTAAPYTNTDIGAIESALEHILDQVPRYPNLDGMGDTTLRQQVLALACMVSDAAEDIRDIGNGLGAASIKFYAEP